MEKHLEAKQQSTQHYFFLQRKRDNVDVKLQNLSFSNWIILLNPFSFLFLLAPACAVQLVPGDFSARIQRCLWSKPITGQLFSFTHLFESQKISLILAVSSVDCAICLFSFLCTCLHRLCALPWFRHHAFLKLYFLYVVLIFISFVFLFVLLYCYFHFQH